MGTCTENPLRICNGSTSEPDPGNKPSQSLSQGDKMVRQAPVFFAQKQKEDIQLRQRGEKVCGADWNK